MDSEGMAPNFLMDMDWQTFDMTSVTQEDLDHVSQPISEFFKTHTMNELYQGALRKRIMLYPVHTIKEVVEDAHLEARGFWTDVEHPELDTNITYPGAFVKLSNNPLRIWRRAPLIGEHNREVYQEELGFSKQELTILKQGAII